MAVIDLPVMNQDAPTSLDQKIELFFAIHVLPLFDPSRIDWWFSLSGGKDSLSMAFGVRNWYTRHEVPLSARGLAIDQWGGRGPLEIAQQLEWLETSLVDGRRTTADFTKYEPGQQAPCRSCADARRNVSDSLLNSQPTEPNRVRFLARGLHLTDTAISLLWRRAMGRPAVSEMIELGKSRPIARIDAKTYLVKPLAYAREYESQAYAALCGYRELCCGCPACRFPSRRDIVEESLATFFEESRWEFDVPGLNDLLSHFGASGLRGVSQGGRESKHAHLPDNFAPFALKQFESRLEPARRLATATVGTDVDLDQIGAAFLRGAPPVDLDQVPAPAFLIGRPLERSEKMMIATMGPFWGAIGLTRRSADQIWKLQERTFGLTLDERWTQVNRLLNDLYLARDKEYRGRRLAVIQ